MRWLLSKFNIGPNAYYNFLKDRKFSYRAKKQILLDNIKSIYHSNNGTLGHRNMKIFLDRKGLNYSKVTVHKYMNKELGLKSIIMKKKPAYLRGTIHKVFPDLLKREFKAQIPNSVWCTDFTYMNLSDGSKRYNCTILDLYDRSVIATLNGKEITSDLAIKTLELAIKNHKPASGLILHSDQGSQYTSKEFTEYCHNKKITQSMSKAGCPYDNSPMERYFNTFKNELIYLFHFKNDDVLNRAVYDYAYSWYNHVRPHSFNEGATPFEARYRSYKKH